MNEDKISQMKAEMALEQKKILRKSYEIQILELEDKIVFTKEAMSRIDAEIAKGG